MNPMIKLRRLEFAVTYNCSSKCAHCFVEDETKKQYPGHLGAEEAAEIVREVATQYDLESVMTFGGEPLLYPEVVSAIHRTATELGIPIRQLITNGYWTKQPERMQEIARMVVDAGVNNILISIDAFHAPYVSVEMLRGAAQAFLDAGVENLKWSPCWVKSPDDDNRYNQTTRELLAKVADLELPVGTGNVLSPNGAAIENLVEFLPPKLTYPTGKCSDQPYTHDLDDLQSLCVEPNGDISICPNFVLGNSLVDEVKELLQKYDPYQVAEMRCVLERGMDGLVELAREAGVELVSDGYYTICDMCQEIVAKLKK